MFGLFLITFDFFFHTQHVIGTDLRLSLLFEHERRFGVLVRAEEMAIDHRKKFAFCSVSVDNLLSNEAS